MANKSDIRCALMNKIYERIKDANIDELEKLIHLFVEMCLAEK